MINTLLMQKLQQGAFLCAAALFWAATPAAIAAENSANAGVVVPDEPDDDEFTAGVPSASEDSEARAVFQAWKRLDTGLAASIGVSVPSRRPIEQMSLSSSYGMRVHPITGRVARHNGIDIPAPHGTPIYATADGIVGRAQRLGGYGNYVEIEHGNAIQTRYGHMSSYIVKSGQQVKKGEIIGYVGSTGRSTGNHLHYEVRIEGAPVNPMPFVRSDQMAIAALTGDNSAMGGPEE
ncbi:M23 family metallopeptidase [Sphingopyxis sp. XHP0097]|uniref:M23 family metallopeptidase n=1 Tax=Sphingopyxis jiangsuensis TaxID=2871171 RepID=A0ABS7M9R8_9SPHN|nr:MULTISPECIES: M23 family metallopeptidase [Sphingopyxis]MBL0769967.1 M23 family metallopeptidase [Sphingopyxis lutea]MBY4635768.1 M23 family metallopeptidase [Sphingopyxis jiangsuensis]